MMEDRSNRVLASFQARLSTTATRPPEPLSSDFLVLDTHQEILALQDLVNPTTIMAPLEPVMHMFLPAVRLEKISSEMARDSWTLILVSTMLEPHKQALPIIRKLEAVFASNCFANEIS